MGRIMRLVRKNYMVDTFLKLKGNTRACVWTEPLWGVPYNLYKPYVARFMIALGLSFTEIGMVATVTYIAEIISAVLSGVLCDKMGRRWCTVVFDTLSWSVPELIWCFSQNANWFIVAALFNGMWRITENSWGLLLVEDTPKDQVVPAFSMCNFMGVIAAFVAPISKFAVDAFGLVPTMRVLYAITCVSMTAKFLILFFCSRETRAGVKRMELTRGKSVFRMIWECKDVYIRIIKERRMLLTLGILAVYALINNVNDNYWATFVVEFMGIKESDLSWFTMIKGIVTLVGIFVLVPKVKGLNFKRPMLVSIGVFALSEVIVLILSAAGGYSWFVWPVLIFCVMLEAAAFSLLSPITGSLLFINAAADERARMCGMVQATIALMVCIFPTIIGRMADISLYIPFGVNLMLFAVIAVLTVLISRLPEPVSTEEIG